MSRQHRPADQSVRMMPMAPYVAALVFTVVLAAGLVLLGIRWASAPRQAPFTLDGRNLPVAAPVTTTPGATPTTNAAADQLPSTRLVVPAAQRLIDRRLAPGAVVDLPLPRLRSGTSALLLQLSMTDATRPGAVTLRSAVEDVPALRLPAAGAQTSGTVVVLLGPDGRLRVSTAGGGRLIADLTGTFEAAGAATAGRVVALPAQRILTLRPLQDGRHDAVLDPARVPAVRAVGSLSAVLLHVVAEVGAHGGHVAVGPSSHHLNQVVYWAATSKGDQTRHGFLVVHVPADGRIRLHYKAGTYLRVDITAVVTGNGAPKSATGLVVPVRGTVAPPVRTGGTGRSDVPVVPAGGLPGAARTRVSGALLTLVAIGDTVGNVSVTAPSTTAPAALTAGGGRPRATLLLTGVRNGAVSVSNESGANVVLTPRVLVLR